MWRKDEDGAYVFTAKLGTVAGEQLVGVLRALSRNERRTVLATGGELTHLRANADALVLLASHFASCTKLPKLGADRPKILVTVNYDTLRTGLGTATLLNTGEQITAREARRLACQADILPAVMGGSSIPLDVGRKKRLFTGHLRAVLIARDQGCAFPGCDRGPEESEAHHILAWYLGGRTSLGNGVLLCPFHHHLVEPNPLWADARNCSSGSTRKACRSSERPTDAARHRASDDGGSTSASPLAEPSSFSVLTLADVLDPRPKRH